MNSILDYLYLCAMESHKSRYLTQEETRDYRAAARYMEIEHDKLVDLLEGEALKLFDLYVENRDDEAHYEDLSTFRVGLAIGLKLGAFGLSER